MPKAVPHCQGIPVDVVPTTTANCKPITAVHREFQSNYRGNTANTATMSLYLKDYSKRRDFKLTAVFTKSCTVLHYRSEGLHYLKLIT